MSWRERDYSQAWADGREIWRRFRVPTRAALVLIGLHAAAFVAVLLLGRSGRGAELQVAALSGASASPCGILLHPWTSASLFSVVLTLVVIWTLAARVEARYGAGRMLALYVGGNTVAGGVYFVIARLAPQLADIPLDYPAGAMAAWCFAVWIGFGTRPCCSSGGCRPCRRSRP
jgi:membrane associated rhomboid family serine protease